VPLPLDREMVARLLGFGRVQNNVLAANNSRGRHEAVVLGAVEQVTQTLSKMAQDLILFSLPELGYFTIPQELCSGSSIMPQKRNPDGLELTRAKSAAIAADLTSIKSVIRALPSGYNRDFQETKGPFFRGCESALGCVRVMRLTVDRLEVNADRLRAAFTPDIFATDRALELVAEGMPFREAYRQVGSSLKEVGERDPAAALRQRTSTGTPGNLRLDVPRADVEEVIRYLEREESARGAALTALMGREVRLFRDPLSVDL